MQQLVDLFGFLSVVLRAGTLVFQSLLLGGIVFVLWIARGAPGNPASIEKMQSGSWTLLRFSTIGLIVMQVLYLYVNSAVLMTTAEIGFRAVLGANFFLSGSIVLAAAVAAHLVARQQWKVAPWLLPVLAMTVLGASVMTNHAASRLDGRPLLIILTTIHEAATAFWIGGLPFLVLALFRDKEEEARWHITERFSRVALVSVGAIVFSGMGMSIRYIASWRAVLGTAYGVMVTAKVLMLAALMLLGGINFWLLRSTRKDRVMPRLRRLIEAEVGIGITVILTAASLTSQPPAVDQPNDTVTFHQIMQRMKPTLPRLTYPQVADASISASGQQATVSDVPNQIPVAYNADGEPLSPQRTAWAMESESNHHWMGLVVLAMGLLALLARTGKAGWAEYWPLLLVGIAIFIFVQADTECWPVGAKGFWACWANPEAFQHRLAALVCVAFAVFELRVRRRKWENDRMALIFPLMVATGGVVLLTHSHAITNVKENLLVELTHVSLGMLAVFAGWARWLEIRLPPKDRAIPAWIWPVCFVLIGVGLLNYREL
jgi:putative copper resistance protein D